MTESKHGSLRRRLENELALELYEDDFKRLEPHQQSDVDRFLETRVMSHVRKYIANNYVRKEPEDDLL